MYYADYRRRLRREEVSYLLGLDAALVFCAFFVLEWCNSTLNSPNLISCFPRKTNNGRNISCGRRHGRPRNYRHGLAALLVARIMVVAIRMPAAAVAAFRQ